MPHRPFVCDFANGAANLAPLSQAAHPIRA